MVRRRKRLQPRYACMIAQKSIAAEAASYDGRSGWLLLGIMFIAFVGADAQARTPASALLDDFSKPSLWRALASDQVLSSLHAVTGSNGKALCLAYDFNGVSGYAAMRRELPITFPPDYELDFKVRGSGPANAFEFKLIDASGDNVWWVSKPNTTFSSEWSPVRYKKRHISPAWGPLTDKTLRQTQFVEFTVSANSGGKGEVCIENLRFRERNAPPTQWPVPKLAVSSGNASAPIFSGASIRDINRIAHAVRHDMFASDDAYAPIGGLIQSALPASAVEFDHRGWKSGADDGPLQQVTADFGALREFGGLTLRWAVNQHASRYDIELSDDGSDWRTVRKVEHGNGGNDYLRLAESEARYLRIVMREGPLPRYGLLAADIEALQVGESDNTFIERIAQEAPPGQFPRGFSGEQSYWTLVGIDGGHESGLLGEDGGIEVARGDFSITPFVLDGEGCASNSNQFAAALGFPYTLANVSNWKEVTIEPRLTDGFLPMPGVTWRRSPDTHKTFLCPMDWRHFNSTYFHGRRNIKPWHLDVDAFAQSTSADSRLVASYTLANDSEEARTLTLAFAIQPFQVNPPVQFLTTPGGVSPIHGLGFDGKAVSVNGNPRVWPLQKPTAFFATPFDNDMVAQHLTYNEWPTAQLVTDETGLASGALIYRIELAAHASKTINLQIPLSGEAETTPLDADAAQAWIDAQREQVASAWKEKLNRVTFKVPPQAQPLVDTLRTALAHILISRDGVQIRPGTRSYARSWIRDGSMTAEALLRMGHTKEARDFLEWFAPFQFDSGKVPCCVDARGSDPVPENDSHGELIYLVAEVARFTQDNQLAATMWPHVDKAIRYMDRLRASERIKANRGSEKFGLLPPSISHEGYSAKPAYSHWDNFWGLTGYNSAIELANMLDRDDDARWISASRDEFRADVLASLAASAKKFDIDYIPGAADLGDFDATSTTIALAPAGQLDHLPADLVHNTFERYWREFVTRRDDTREWNDYTPYEWRNVGAFIRLGWRDRAHEAIDFFFKDRRPLAWNQWAEVVGKDARKPRFIGDMPHGWVASDFIRSALDLFAYERESDRSIVLAAGIPDDWLAGNGIAIEGLRTPFGSLGYSLKRTDRDVRLTLHGDPQRMPPGGYVLVWPGADKPGRTTINGRLDRWIGRELHIATSMAEVVIAD